MISANFDSICHFKWVLESMIAGCKLDRSVPLPKSLRSLYQEHAALLQRMCTPGGDDTARANQLLRILQLELIWCGQFL
jgi:hypothetical protein